MPRHLFQIFFLLACLSAVGPLSARHVCLGVEEFALENQRDNVVEALQKALGPVFSQQGVEVREYSVVGLEQAVLNGEVDIVLSSAGLPGRHPSLLTPVAVAMLPGVKDPNRTEGSLFIVGKHSNAESLTDLRNQILIANFEQSFTGYAVAKAEIAKFTTRSENFFGSEKFVGKADAVEEIIEAVASGSADVGILKRCALETFAAKHPDKVLDIKPLSRADVSGCMSSTELYPAQTISVASSIEPKVARAVTLQLLMMQPTQQGVVWTSVTERSHVDQLMRRLREGPYQYLREWTLKRFALAAWPWFMLFFAAILGLIWHSRRTARLLKQKELLLRDMFARDAEQKEKLEAFQRSGTVSLMSNMVAHELRQPLAALTLYADSLGMMMEEGELQKNRLPAIVNGISRESERASRIVESVRNYAQNRTSSRLLQPLEPLLREAIRIFKLSRGAEAIDLTTNICARNVCAKVNDLEITTVFVNLLRNAREALMQCRDKRICVRLYRETSDCNAVNKVVIEVSDSGPELTQEELARLGSPQNSSKNDGLGLGLSLVKMIIEAHGGNISFHCGTQNYSGLTVRVELPEGTTTDDKHA